MSEGTDIGVWKDLAHLVHGFARDATASEASHRLGRLILPEIGAATVVQKACMQGGLSVAAEACDCAAARLRSWQPYAMRPPLGWADRPAASFWPTHYWANPFGDHRRGDVDQSLYKPSAYIKRSRHDGTASAHTSHVL